MTLLQKIGTVIAVGLTMFALSTVANATERDDIKAAFKTVTPSVGALYHQEMGGDIKFVCTATAVGRHKNETIVLTAHHCLGYSNVSYLINFGDNVMRTVRPWKIPHYKVDVVKFPRKYGEPETDMALFLMAGQDVPIVEMGTSDDVEDGDKIVMVGYPLGVTQISYEGTVGGKFDRKSTDMYNYLMLQIFGAPGSSGSSIVSLDTGKVIGILVAARGGSGLPVIFATPIDYRKWLMNIDGEEANDEEVVDTEEDSVN